MFIEKILQSKNTIESRVIKLKGQKRSKESKQKMSISALSLNKNLSEEHKSKLKNLHKNNTYRVGKKHSEESKQKMRKPKTKEHILKLHGRKYTEEQKLKMSLLKIGKPSNRCKPVLQYDLNNNFIKEWISVTEANKYHKGDIRACCRGKQKIACGYKWKFKQ